MRPDMTAGIRQAVDHLVALGHTDFGYLSGNANSWMNDHASSLVASECARHGVNLRVFGPYTTEPEGGAAALEPVLASKVTAVLAFNDLMALGLMAQLEQRGLKCPSHVSVIGVDDIPYAAISSPPLTTVRVTPVRVGAGAVELLLDVVEGRLSTPERRTTDGSQLVVRGSTSTVRPQI